MVAGDDLPELRTQLSVIQAHAGVRYDGRRAPIARSGVAVLDRPRVGRVVFGAAESVAVLAGQRQRVGRSTAIRRQIRDEALDCRLIAGVPREGLVARVPEDQVSAVGVHYGPAVV